MDATQFLAWREHMGLSKNAVARLMGVAPNTVACWEEGSSPIKAQTELACCALTLGFTSFDAVWAGHTGKLRK